MFQGSVAGFVLVGGKSLRMGHNKALLPLNGHTLAQHIAGELAWVASPVALVGPPEFYASLALPVVPDSAEGRGPLSGIEAALCSPYAREWNLIAACDMPRISANLFRNLLDAIDPKADCIVPRSTSGKLEPLCALYKQSCAPHVTSALAAENRRVVDVVQMLQAKFWPIPDAALFQNVNTPHEWDQFLNDRRISALP